METQTTQRVDVLTVERLETVLKANSDIEQIHHKEIKDISFEIKLWFLLNQFEDLMKN
jgi:hypothetical protein